MSDFMVYWKNYERDTNKAGNSGIADDWYWHTGKESIYNQLSEGDNLWVLIRDSEAKWKLLSKIKIARKKIDRDVNKFEVKEYGQYHFIGDPKKSERFDIVTQADFEPILRQLEFGSGQKITATGKRIGLSFQAPRRLSVKDGNLLSDYQARLRSGNLSFWWVNHKQTVRSEIEGGYIWSPKTNRNGASNQTYLNLTLTNAGDIVFS